MFESISDYKKIVVLIFLIEDDKKLVKENGLCKNDTNRSNLDIKIILIEQHEEYLDYVENEEKSIIGNFLNK